jgi:VWFA-related protein
MNERVSFHFITAILSVSLSVALFCSFAFGQSSTRKKPKLKDFGSSVKRLKWDPDRNAAVETRAKKDKTNAAEQEDVVRVETSLVVSDVLVLDQRGQPVPGLTQNDFVVTEDGKPQQVGMFSRGDNVTVPRSIVLIIDYGCTQLPFLEASVEAAKNLVDKLGPRDSMAIVTDDVELLVNFTQDKRKLKDRLDALKRRTRPDASNFSDTRRFRVPFGRGFQYSALMAVLKEAFDDEDERPIIIFQTDGSEAKLLRNPIVSPSVPPGLPSDMQAEEQGNLEHFRRFQLRNPREFGLNDVYQAAEKSRTTIYTIVPGFRLIGLSNDEQVAQTKAYYEREISYSTSPTLLKHEQDRLKRMPIEWVRYEAEQQLKLQSALAVLSTIAGGWIEFFDQPSQADGIYSRILSDINRRYVVGYYPTKKEHDGKRRKVKVEVRGHPEYTVTGRKSYFAAGPDQ